MSVVVGDLVYLLGIDTGKFDSALTGAQRNLSVFQRTGVTAGNSLATIGSQGAAGLRVLNTAVGTSTAELQRMEKAGRSTGDTLTKALGGLAIGAAAKSGLDTFLDVSQKFNLVSTLLPDMNGKQLDKVKTQYSDLARQLGVLQSDLLPAVYAGLSSGVDTTHMRDYLTVITEMGRGGAPLDGIGRALTGVANAYHTTNFVEIGDTLAKIVDLGAGDLSYQTLSTEMSKVTPIAAALGISLDDVSAAIIANSQAGASTSDNLSQLQQMFNELGNTGLNAAKALKEQTGYTFTEYLKHGGNLKGALVEIDAYAKKTGSSLGMMFGDGSRTAALQLMANGASAFSIALAGMAEKAGTLARFNQKMQTEDQKAAQTLANNFETLKIEGGKALVPLMEDLAGVSKSLAGLAENDTAVEIAKWVGGFLLLAKSVAMVKDMVGVQLVVSMAKATAAGVGRITSLMAEARAADMTTASYIRLNAVTNPGLSGLGGTLAARGEAAAGVRGTMLAGASGAIGRGAAAGGIRGFLSGAGGAVLGGGGASAFMPAAGGSIAAGLGAATMTIGLPVAAVGAIGASAAIGMDNPEMKSAGYGGYGRGAAGVFHMLDQVAPGDALDRFSGYKAAQDTADAVARGDQMRLDLAIKKRQAAQVKYQMDLAQSADAARGATTADKALADQIGHATPQQIEQASKAWQDMQDQVKKTTDQIASSVALFDAAPERFKPGAGNDLGALGRDVEKAQIDKRARQADLDKVRADGSATTDQRRLAELALADSLDQVTAAQKRLADASKANKATDQSLSAAELAKNIAGQAAYQMREAGGVKALMQSGLTPDAVSDLLDVEKSHPGTIARVVEENIGKPTGAAFVKALNDSVASIKSSSNTLSLALNGQIQEAGSAAASTSYQEGKKAGQAWMKGYGDGLGNVPLPPTPGLVLGDNGATGGGGVRGGAVGGVRGGAVGAGIVVQNMTVNAQDPGAIGRALNQQSALNNLGGPR